MNETYQASHAGRIFVIEPDIPNIGVYLYVYEDHKCVRDYLQNDIKTCIELAFEEYDVPMDAWTKTMKERASSEKKVSG
jgi:hypothetical protein